MTYPHRPIDRLLSQPTAAEPPRAWTVNRPPRPARTIGQTRRYEMSWLDEAGEIVDSTRVAPAMPAFEYAFSAFARGAVVSTPAGPVAVEDLLPGTTVNTRSGPAVVRWVGRILLPPTNLRQESGPDIFRLTADSFGHDRPAHDMVLGSAARLVRKVGRTGGMQSLSEALVPIGDYADGVAVMKLAPMSAVPAFHIMLDRQAVLEVNGLPIASYHPGRDLTDTLAGDLLRLFLSFFPWIKSPSGFGPAVLPVMGLDEIEAIDAA